ncbi:hypothetical protein [Clostridium saccharoperbutylacetonicum]|uniref:hypothetical protein n=1 Tax=Clostridium saccharoperbutylacetonicum TaxID=36745 RepID=UPI0039E817D7
MVVIRYRILDANGDMTFGRGSQNLTYGSYAVGQAIQTRLKLLKGEWFEDTEDGLPLFQQILGTKSTKNNLQIIDSLIRERILGTTDVTGITEYNSNSSNEDRSYSFTAKVNTNYGTVTISNTL